MKYNIIIHEMLVVYRTVISFILIYIFTPYIYSHHIKILQYDILQTYEKLLFYTPYFIFYILTFPFYQEQQSM